MLNSEAPYVRCLDRSDREDIRLHQPRCANASAYGLRGYVDNTLPSRCYAITMILRVRRNFFEITMFPNHEMFQELKLIFQANARVDRYEVSNKFYSCKMEENSSVSEHILKMSGYHNHLTHLGVDRKSVV